ncbi:MAG: exodeoxyribonuclease [Pseudomonadota bacterium]|jgi:exodeoxyribonuclease-3|nr:exodeoxyribonuclease III [Burkholderiales bacterium]
MQIATWNVNSLKVRLPQVLEWLQTNNCDILALQELKQDNCDFPQTAFENIGYYCAFNGQKTYNGVAIISKYPLTDIIYDIPNFADPQKRVITATANKLRIICAYVVNGENLLSDKYQYKLTWLSALTNYLKHSLTENEHMVVLGDFNIAPEDIDVHNPELWHEQVLCSQQERMAWQEIINLGLYDSFRIFNTQSKQFTWWDYRGFAFKRQMGLRIDHILINKKLYALATNCRVDVNPRKNERPSDHAPLILELNWS